MAVLALLLTLLTIIMVSLVLITSHLRHSQQNLNAVHDEMRQLSYALVDMSHSIGTVSHEIKKVKLAMDQEKLEHATQKPMHGADSAYKQALKMVEIGANLEDIISTCSLTRAEVQLLMNLKRFDSHRM